MFGTLGVFAFIGMAVTENRRREVLGEESWQSLSEATSVLPFVALLRGRARWPTDRTTLIGAIIGLLAAVFLLTYGHLWLFERDPLALL